MERLRDLGTGPTPIQLLIVALLALAGALFCAPVLAQDETPGRPRLLIELPITINGTDAGAVQVDMGDARALEVSLVALRRALSEALSEDALSGLDAEIARRRGDSSRLSNALSRIGPRAEDSSVVGSLLDEAGLDPTQALPERQDYVLIDDVAAITGLPVRFDNRSASVAVAVPTDQLRALSISLRRNDVEARSPSAPARRSAFLNARVSGALHP